MEQIKNIEKEPRPGEDKVWWISLFLITALVGVVGLWRIFRLF